MKERRITPMTLLTVAKELLIVSGIYLAGEALASLLEIGFPGSVIGMLLLLAALHLKWIKVDDIRYVASFLLGYMPLFFIPAGVGVMASYTLMEGFYLPVIVLTLVSTVVVMAVTGRLVQFLVQRGET